MRRFLLGSVAAGVLLAGEAGPAAAITIREDAAPEGIAAYYDSGNVYANVGALRTGTKEYCTGTLLNARTFLTASHCFTLQSPGDQGDIWGPLSNVTFSPEDGGPAAAQVSSVRTHPGYSGAIPTNDVALVALASPVTGLVPVQLATTAPATGQMVILVGYGWAALGSDPGGAISDNRRRVAANILDYVGPAAGLPGLSGVSDQIVVATDFDQAGNPRASSMGSTDPVALEGSTQAGDSGGPVFIIGPDGQLIQIGVLTGGYTPPGVDATKGEAYGHVFVTYGDASFWPAIWTFQDWIAQNSFLQSASAVAGDGLWSSASHWSGGMVPNNSTGYVSNGAARYYDVSLNQPGTTLLDMNAMVDTLAVDHPDAALDIAAPYSLTAEVGTTLAQGQMFVSGSLVSPWLQVKGGTLGGSGRIVAPQGVSQTGGTISPGGSGSIGTLAIDGSFSQSGGVLLAEITSSAADRLAASGAVRLAGALQLALLGATPPAAGTVFTLASGSSLDASALPAPDAIGAVSFSLANVGGELQVTVGRQALTGFAASGNGREVAAALDAVRGNAAFAPVFDSLDPLPAFQMARALDQIGGVSTTAGTVARASSAQFLGAASQRLAGVRSGSGSLGSGNATALRALLSPEPETAALRAADEAPAGEVLARPRLSGPTDGQGATVAEAPVFALGRDSGVGLGSELRWGVWVQPYGVKAHRRGDAAGDRYDTTIGGVTGGLDYRLSGDGVTEGLVVGASLGYARSDTGYRELTDETKSRSYQAGVYGGWWQGPWSADAGLGLALNRYESRRDLNFGTTLASAEGDHDGREYSAYLEGRYTLDLAVGGPGRLELVPMAGLQALRLETDGYTETGAGPLNLSVASDRVTSLRSSLGLSVAYPLSLTDGTVLRPEARARWSHEFGDTDTVVDASFAAAPGPSFRIGSGELGRDAALLGLGLEAQLSPQVSLSAAWDGQFQDGYSAQAVTGRIRVAF